MGKFIGLVLLLLIALVMGRLLLQPDAPLLADCSLAVPASPPCTQSPEQCLCRLAVLAGVKSSPF